MTKSLEAHCVLTYKLDMEFVSYIPRDLLNINFDASCESIIRNIQG